MGVSLRESPSWKGGHYCHGAGGTLPDLPLWDFPVADGASPRVMPPGLLPPHCPQQPRMRRPSAVPSSTRGPSPQPYPWGDTAASPVPTPHPIPAGKTPRSSWSRNRPAPAPAPAPARPLCSRDGPHFARAAGGCGAQGAASCPPDGASVHQSAEGIARLLCCHRPWVVATGE